MCLYDFAIPLGIISVFLAVTNIRDMRRRHGRLTTGSVVMAALGWYMISRSFVDFYGYGGNYRLAAFAFLFLGISPLLGFLLFWEDGKLAKGLLKVGIFLVIGLIVFIIHQVLFGSELLLQGLLLSVGISALVMSPARKVWKDWRKKRARSVQMKQEQKLQAKKEEFELAEREEKERQKREFLELVLKELRE